MKHHFVIAISMTLCAFSAEKPIKLSELPAPVRKTVQDQTKDATLLGVSKEVEGGKTLYEIETTRNGKTRDLILNTTGAIVEVEEELPLSAVPAPAQSAITKKAAGGKVTKVEALTKGGTTTYEAAITKNGKKSEFGVTANGADVK